LTGWLVDYGLPLNSKSLTPLILLVVAIHLATPAKRLTVIEQKDLVNHDIVLIAVSTTGQGDLPLNAQVLWKKLLSARLRPGCLSRLRFAIFGLGDSSYVQ